MSPGSTIRAHPPLCVWRSREQDTDAVDVSEQASSRRSATHRSSPLSGPAQRTCFSVQESGSGTFLRAPLHGIVPAGLVALPRVILRTASGKKEPDPGPLNTYRSTNRRQATDMYVATALRTRNVGNSRPHAQRVLPRFAWPRIMRANWRVLMARLGKS